MDFCSGLLVNRNQNPGVDIQNCYYQKCAIQVAMLHIT